MAPQVDDGPEAFRLADEIAVALGIADPTSKTTDAAELVWEALLEMPDAALAALHKAVRQLRRERDTAVRNARRLGRVR